MSEDKFVKSSEKNFDEMVKKSIAEYNSKAEINLHEENLGSGMSDVGKNEEEFKSKHKINKF